jgi:hypothetical protein
VPLPDALPIGPVRRDEGGDDDGTGPREKRGHLAEATGILRAICGRKPEVGAQSPADSVAVKQKHLTADVEERSLEPDCERGLA